MRGKPVNRDEIVRDFQLLAAKIGQIFTIRDAEAAQAWSCYKSRATGLKFNEVKALAGLPFKTRAPNGQGGKNNKYEPCKIKVGKGKKKQCLGILPDESYCQKKVVLPARLCNRCRERNQTL